MLNTINMNLKKQADWAQPIISEFDKNNGFSKLDNAIKTHKQFLISGKKLISNNDSKENLLIDSRDALALWSIICIEIGETPPKILIDLIKSCGAEHPLWIGQLAFSLINYLFDVEKNNNNLKTKGKYDVKKDIIPVESFYALEVGMYRTIYRAMFDAMMSDVPTQLSLNEFQLLYLNKYDENKDNNIIILSEQLKYFASMGMAESEFILGLLADEHDDWFERSSKSLFPPALFYQAVKLYDADLNESLKYFKKVTLEEVTYYLGMKEIQVDIINHISMSEDISENDWMFLASFVDKSIKYINELEEYFINENQKRLKERFSFAQSEIVDLKKEIIKNKEHYIDEYLINFQNEFDSNPDFSNEPLWRNKLESSLVFEQFQKVRRCKLKVDKFDIKKRPELTASLLVETGKLFEVFFKWCCIQWPVDNKDDLFRIPTNDKNNLEPASFFEELEKMYKINIGYNIKTKIKEYDTYKFERQILKNSVALHRGNVDVMSSHEPLRCYILTNILNSAANIDHPFRHLKETAYKLSDTRDLYQKRNEGAHYSSIEIQEKTLNETYDSVLDWIDGMMEFCITYGKISNIQDKTYTGEVAFYSNKSKSGWIYIDNTCQKKQASFNGGSTSKPLKKGQKVNFKLKSSNKGSLPEAVDIYFFD